jgi:hypothetical protein
MTTFHYRFGGTPRAPHHHARGIAGPHRPRRTASLVALAIGLVSLLPATAHAATVPEITCDGLPATIVGTERNDAITGTGGRDIIAALGGNDRVSAGPGNDVVCLGPGNDALNGGAGHDFFVADTVADGTDAFAGGSGLDTARYAGRAAAIAVSLDNEPDDGARGEDDNIHVDVENVVGGLAGNTLRGSAANNLLVGGDVRDVIDGGAGADALHGAGGNDIFVGGPGDDSITGGADDDLSVADAGPDGADVFEGGDGRDTAAYAGRTTGIRVFLDGFANDGALPFGEGDNVGGPASDVETVIGGSGNDSFNARVFFAGAHLQGRAGDDSFTTTNGVVDTVDGGIGNDRCLDDPTDIRISCEG